MNTIALLLLVCFQVDLPGSEAISQQQVTFLTASKAEVTEQDGKAVILAEDLSKEVSYGVLVKIEAPVKWIEIHPVEKPFPPIIQTPFRDKTFLIRGSQGQKFYVSGRGTDVPFWFDVSIDPRAPQPPPVDPNPPVDPVPPDSLGKIEKISRDGAARLNDPTTAKALAKSIDDAAKQIDARCAVGQCPTLSSAKDIMIKAIEDVMVQRQVPSGQWLQLWRNPVSDAIKAANPADLKTYVSMMRAAAKGLQ